MPKTREDGLTQSEYEWLRDARGVMDYPPPHGLCLKNLAEQIGLELFYPPCWQLTQEGRDLQKALVIENALKKDTST